MPENPRLVRISAFIEPAQRRRLQQLARKVSFERGAKLTFSDTVRDALDFYLEHSPEARLHRIAEERAEYDADAEGAG